MEVTIFCGVTKYNPDNTTKEKSEELVGMN
jgi:hypothetical protein